jgi:hypothetical protein
MTNTKFFTFNQNNSGGSFDEDKASGIGYRVCIEAVDAAHALARAEGIGLYFNGCADGIDCECCGDRWSNYIDDDDVAETPTQYGGPITGGWGISSFIHYLDGRVEEVSEQPT